MQICHPKELSRFCNMLLSKASPEAKHAETDPAMTHPTMAHFRPGTRSKQLVGASVEGAALLELEADHTAEGGE